MTIHLPHNKQYIIIFVLSFSIDGKPKESAITCFNTRVLFRQKNLSELSGGKVDTFSH